MPTVQGISQKAISANIAKLIADGMPRDQVAAIAYDKADSARIMDSNGWFEVRDNPLSKVGVFQYLGKYIPGADPERIYNVFRSAEELGSDATLQSIRLMPWIDDHVMLGSADDGYTPAEEKIVHGVIGEQVYFKGDTLYGNLKLFSEELANNVEAGKNELSLGYRCKYKLQPGVWEGQPYDYIQYAIRGNHIASVDEGRMGADVAVLDHFKFTFDAKDITTMADEKTPPADTGNSMSLEDAIKAVNGLLPVLLKLAGLSAPPTAAAIEGDTPPTDADTLAATDDEETEEEKVARLKKEAEDAKNTATDADEDKEAKAMDARIAKHIRDAAGKQPSVAQLTSTILANIARRDALASQLAEHGHAFDHKDKTLQEVAALGVTKLGLKNVAKGGEVAALDVYLQVAQPAGPTSMRTGHGFDAADTTKTPAFLAAYVKGN